MFHIAEQRSLFYAATFSAAAKWLHKTGGLSSQARPENGYYNLK